MGFFKTRVPLMAPGQSVTLVGSASSAAKVIGPRGAFVLVSTSTVATTPTVAHLAAGRVGDIVDVYCREAASSAGFCLRTSSSATYIGSSSGAYDQLQFFYGGVGARLICLSTTLWGQVGATTTATSGLPLLTISTS